MADTQNPHSPLNMINTMAFYKIKCGFMLRYDIRYRSHRPVTCHHCN